MPMALSLDASTGTSTKLLFTVSKNVPPGGYAAAAAIVKVRFEKAIEGVKLLGNVSSGQCGCSSRCREVWGAAQRGVSATQQLRLRV